MDVILGLSLKFIRWDNQGSRGSKSLQLWLRRAIIQNKRLNNFKEKLAQSLPLHKHLRFRQNIQQCMQRPAKFFPTSKGFLASLAQKRTLFLKKRFYVSKCHKFFLEHKVFFVEQSVAPIGFFSSLRFYFSAITLILQSWRRVT